MPEVDVPVGRKFDCPAVWKSGDADGAVGARRRR